MGNDYPCHSEERSDVGISWECVLIRTLPQEIATALRPRNDSVFWAGQKEYAFVP